MHASSKLESVFIEIICPNFSNLTIGCIYEHAHICNFNSNYISPLFLQKLSKQSSKQMFLLGDFNIDLVKYESFELVNSFLDTLSSIFLSPQLIFPNRISSLSTLIGNIFCHLTHTTKSISGNLAFCNCKGTAVEILYISMPLAQGWPSLKQWIKWSHRGGLISSNLAMRVGIKYFF